MEESLWNGNYSNAVYYDFPDVISSIVGTEDKLFRKREDHAMEDHWKAN